MAQSFIFDNAKKLIGNGSIKLQDVNGIYRLALFTGDIFTNIPLYRKKTLWSEISGMEITNSNIGYERKKILNIGIVVDPLNDINYMVYADDIIYGGGVSTITASAAVIVKLANATADITADSLLVACIDLRQNNAPVISNNGTFTIKMSQSSGGYLMIK